MAAADFEHVFASWVFINALSHGATIIGTGMIYFSKAIALVSWQALQIYTVSLNRKLYSQVRSNSCVLLKKNHFIFMKTFSLYLTKLFIVKKWLPSYNHPYLTIHTETKIL